jgi:predicted Ser/Thr protein kinase
MMIYKPTSSGQQVLVVAEGATGIKTTYTFKVDSDVYVSYTHNVVLLPSQCVQMVRGVIAGRKLTH